jgi:hypothetical protein
MVAKARDEGCWNRAVISMDAYAVVDGTQGWGQRMLKSLDASEVFHGLGTESTQRRIEQNTCRMGMNEQSGNAWNF